MKYMLDTNVFDYIVDEDLKMDVADAVELFVTNVQVSEIKNVPDDDRRMRLQRALKSLPHTELVVSSPFWEDALHWNDDAVWQDEPSSEYEVIRGKSNANRDSLIVEKANSSDMVLVTSDRRCGKSANRVGVKVLSAADFFRSL